MKNRSNIANMGIKSVEKKADALVARFFSESTIRSFLHDTKSAQTFLSEFQYHFSQSDSPFQGGTYRDLFDFAYKYLLKNYRNEYIYKNAIAKNILLGKHSLNTAVMLQEFRIGKCKADTVVLNGTSNVYEIKSELDTLDRLQKQISAYLEVFDMVHVITFPGQSKKIQDVVPKCVGLMELTKRNSITVIREAKSGKQNILCATLFDSLRKSEYENIITSFYGEKPEVPNSLSYRECKKWFIQIPPDIAHDFAIEELKKRGNSVQLKDFVTDVPDYFKSLSLKAKFTQSETRNLSALLDAVVYL